MSLFRKTYDAQALAVEMLPTFKAWARIDHTDDDAALTLTLARTIGLLERQWGILIASQEWTWTPRDSQSPLHAVDDNRLCCCNGAPPYSWGFLPVPLRGITNVKVTRADVDVSDEFRLAGDITYSDFSQIYLQGINGAELQTDDAVALTTEMTQDVVPYEMVDVILRYALFLWENRESATERGMSDVPDWVNRAWGPFWSPRV